MGVGFDSGTGPGQQLLTLQIEGQAPPEMYPVEAALAPSFDPAPASPASASGHALRNGDSNELWKHRAEALHIGSQLRSTIRSPVPVARALFGRTERHEIEGYFARAEAALLQRASRGH